MYTESNLNATPQRKHLYVKKVILPDWEKPWRQQAEERLIQIHEKQAGGDRGGH